MGIHDRDYYRNPPRQGSAFYGSASAWSITTWLIGINVAVFLLNAVVVASRPLLVGYDLLGNAVYAEQPYHPIDRWGYFSVVTAVLGGQVWRFVTFQFLHANFNHILSNMVGLFFFGPLIEEYLGRRRYLAFYLLCGMAGPVAYMVLWALHLLGQDGPATPLVGASAGIFGVLIAGAMVAPDATVLIMGIVPMKLRTFAWVLLAVAGYTIFTAASHPGNNAGGQAAHLGGAAVGYLLIRDRRLLAWADRLGTPRVTPVRYRP